MIHEEKCYCAVCDNCQETMITYHDGYSLFPDKDRMKEAMEGEEWYTGGDPDHEDMHYCPNCFKPHPEEDDKIIVDESRKKEPS